MAVSVLLDSGDRVLRALLVVLEPVIGQPDVGDRVSRGDPCEFVPQPMPIGSEPVSRPGWWSGSWVRHRAAVPGAGRALVDGTGALLGEVEAAFGRHCQHRGCVLSGERFPPPNDAARNARPTPAVGGSRPTSPPSGRCPAPRGCPDSKRPLCGWACAGQPPVDHTAPRPDNPIPTTPHPRHIRLGPHPQAPSIHRPRSPASAHPQHADAPERSWRSSPRYSIPSRQR